MDRWLGGRDRPPGRVDAIVEALVAGRPLKLIIEAKREAFPRDVCETIWRLRNYLSLRPEGDREIVPFVVARAISQRARDILLEEGIGFYDMGGTLYIPTKQAFVYIDRPAPRKSSKIFDSVFLAQKARAVQAVFARSDSWLSVKQIAKETEVSAATASATLNEMERREWVDVGGAGHIFVSRSWKPDGQATHDRPL